MYIVIMMTYLVLPMIVCGIGMGVKTKNLKNKYFWLNLFEVSVVINAVCMIVWYTISIVFNHYSANELLHATFNEAVVYKYWLLEIAATGLLTYIIFPILTSNNICSKFLYFSNKDKIKWNQQMMYFILTCTIAVVVYSCMTYGQICMNSDTSTAVVLAREQIKSLSLLPKNWCYVNGDIWLLSQNLIEIPITLLFHNQTAGRCFESLLLVLITLICISYQGKKLFQDKSYLITIPLFCICLRGMLDFILYQAAYTSQMLFITISTSWFYLATHSKKRKKTIEYVVSLFVLITLMTANGTRIIAEIDIPLIGTICIIFYLNFRNNKLKDCVKEVKRTLLYLFLIIIPTVLGLTLYWWICQNNYVVNTINNSLIFVDSLANAWNNVCLTLQNAFSIFGYSGSASVLSINGFTNLVSIAICILIVFVLPILQLRKLNEENEGVQYFTIFGIIHNVLMLILIIFLGKNTDRYLLTSIFICVLISGHYIYKYWLIDCNLLQVVTIGGIIIVIGIESASMIHMSNNWKDNLNTKLCTVKALENHGLQYGYASYWNAGVNTVYSNYNIQVNAIVMANNEDGSAEAFSSMYWLSSKERYRSSSWDGPTFLLLTTEENDVFQASTLPNILGSTIDRFEIPETKMYVYVYDYNIINVLNNFIYYNYNFSNQKCLSKGEDVGGVRHIKSGGVSSGPYIRLPKGTYTVDIQGTNLNLADYDCAYNGSKDIFNISDCQVSPSEIKYIINVTKDTEGVETRVFNNTKDDTDITLTKLSISRSY